MKGDFRKSKSVLGFPVTKSVGTSIPFLQHKYKEVHLHLKEDID
jgi:hypothetical protein